MKTKKAWWFFLSLLFFLFLPTAVFALEDRVIDNGHLFNQTEYQEIANRLSMLRQETSMDAVVVTTTSTEGKNPVAYADDFYDTHQFGIGKNKDGFLFLIDMEHRRIVISTSGEMRAYLSDKRIKKLLDAVIESMKEEEYAETVYGVIGHISTYYQNGVPTGMAYDASQDKVIKVRSFTPLKTIIALIVGLIAGGMFYFSTSSSYRLKSSSYKFPYREKGSLSLSDKQDQLINTQTTSRRIPRSNSNGGGGNSGSSSHTSSSGRSHGGGSRGF